MTTINKRLAAAALTLAVAAAATPSFAQRGDQQRSSSAREQALRECSTQGYRQYAQGAAEITSFRVCMNERGQQE